MFEYGYESDEDYDVFFLKQANEYNIADKIKEANEKLFAHETLANEREDVSVMGIVKKVRFALNLETRDTGKVFHGKESQSGENETDDSSKSEAAEFHKESLQTTEEPGTHIRLTSFTSNQLQTDESGDSHGNLESLNADKETVEEIRENLSTLEVTETAGGSTAVSQLQQRAKMVKQATVDLVKGDAGENYTADESINGQTKELVATEEDKRNSGDEDDDDDDHLSTVVATSIQDDADTTNQRVELPKINARISRLPVRHYNILLATPTPHTMPPEVTPLRFSYRICCEYRQAVNEKLPKYTGYHSEYGLTHEQLAKRQERLQQHQRSVFDRTLRLKEQAAAKVQDNERAFTSWLKRKMRFPVNQTRNMFDMLSERSDEECVVKPLQKKRSKTAKLSKN